VSAPSTNWRFPLTLDQRGYLVRMAQLTAERRAEQLHVAAMQTLDSAHTSSALAQAAEVALAEREWRRIIRACEREDRRLARLKHADAAALGGAA
jgi:hypothetical protein